MKNDRQIIISTGNTRRDLVWKQTRMTVSELYKRLSTPVRGTETLQEYIHMKKSQQDDLKDIGGFVGGILSGPRRKATAVTGRDLITLDFDNVPGWQAEFVAEKMDALTCSYAIYSTRKHTPAAPRLRIVVPTDRTMSPDEYEPCARRVAAHIGIGMADPTTFEVCRLMYWPSCCADSEFFFRQRDAQLLSVDFLLGTYLNWHDLQSWPQVPGAVSYQRLAMKQGDPTLKQGLVGTFCRTYDIREAMETFLPGIYAPVDTDDSRYTYLGGSTTGGAVVYDNGKYLYSHHATDPCSGRLVNAFDLVRLHKYGDEDDGAAPDTPISKLPSYKDMCRLALQDKAVIAALNREQHERTKKEFAELENKDKAGAKAPKSGDGGEDGSGSGSTGGDGSGEDDYSEETSRWAEALQRNQNGSVKNTIDNILIILDGDPLLTGKFALNKFAGRGEVLGSLPWEKSKDRRLWSDTDSNGLYWYLERYWGISNKGNIDSALDIHASEHAFNEIQDFLERLVWDGTPRLDTLFIDYLGADDTIYNRAVCRKSFTAAVARAMRPGCKFDNMLILAGPQGIGKSTVLDKMSMGWFNDSLRTFEGKDASELLQGVWLVEVSELEAFRKTDVSRIKQFLSLRVDRYRAAYGRHVKEMPRSCVFFGTTNSTAFLSDMTGNRRFWPVDVGRNDHEKSVFKDLTTDVIRQIWAEAKARWQAGEPLYLTGEAEEQAREMQEEHREASPREGLIAAFANKEVPEDWQKWTLDRRRDFWAGGVRGVEGMAEPRLVERDRICALEVWCEVFNASMRDMKPSDTREINMILERLTGWKRADKSMRFGPYSVQRGFVRNQPKKG